MLAECFALLAKWRACGCMAITMPPSTKTPRGCRTSACLRAKPISCGLSRALLAAHQRLLLDRGRTPNTVREAFTYLSGIMQIAVEYGRLPPTPLAGFARRACLRARRSARCRRSSWNG
jgi:hypothetical protein